MKYKIDIKGMQCTGCSNLIKMNLEDSEFTNVFIDLENNNGNFSSEENIKDVKSKVEKVFKEIPEYTFLNLKTI